VPALIEALKDEDEWVREAAAQALQKIGDKSALTPLVRAEITAAIGELEVAREHGANAAIRILEGN
jgi:HEAT repeat protein